MTDVQDAAAGPPKRGAKPKRGATSSDRLAARVLPADKAAWEVAAAADGKSLSAWVVDVCNAEARKVEGGSDTAALRKPPHTQ